MCTTGRQQRAVMDALNSTREKMLSTALFGWTKTDLIKATGAAADLPTTPVATGNRSYTVFRRRLAL